MRKGEVWFTEIPIGSGHEQVGKRPAVLMSQPEAGTVMAVPLTSNLQALKYSYTLELLPSPDNGLKTVSVALVFQLRAIDIGRLDNRVGFLGQDDMAEIDSSVRDLLGL